MRAGMEPTACPSFIEEIGGVWSSIGSEVIRSRLVTCQHQLDVVSSVLNLTTECDHSS
jgi:hypothetical protein